MEYSVSELLCTNIPANVKGFAGVTGWLRIFFLSSGTEQLILHSLAEPQLELYQNNQTSMEPATKTAMPLDGTFAGFPCRFPAP